MKILLTGSNGFIGQYYCQNSKYKEKISPLSFQKDDIADHNLSAYSAIIHLAALVHQMKEVSSQEYDRINVVKTLELANKAKSDGVRFFIFMSTIKVYGEESQNVYTEATPCNPQDDYAKSKYKAEKALLQLEDTHFKVCIIRPPLVYGHGVKGNIKNLIKLVQRSPILPFGDIHNSRSLVYVGNLSHMIDTIIAQEANGIFIAADDSPLNTRNLIEKITKALGVKRVLISLPLFPIVLKTFTPSLYQRLYASLTVDNSWSKQTLDFCNPYSTDEGINLMIQGEQ